MKNFRSNFVSLLFVFMLAVILWPSAADAAGTLAGTQITNQAFATYKDANNNPMSQVFSNVVTTIVAQIAVVELVPNTGNAATTAGGSANFLAQIFNRGNATDTYTFTYSLEAGSTFVPTVEFFYDRAVGGVQHFLDAEDPQILPSGGIYYTPVPAVMEDDVDVYLKTSIPAGVTSGQATVKITAVSVFDPTKTATGFYTVNVSSAVVVATKSVTPAKPAPGETLTYTIVIRNNGTTDATSLIASDPLPLGITYVPNSIKVNTLAKTDAADGDNADFGISVTSPRNGVFVNVGTLAAGGQVTVTFDATVNVGVVAGTTITNKMSAFYSDGAKTIRIDSNGLTFFVAGTAGIDLTAAATAASGDPGDKVAYPLTIANKGNTPDLFDLTYTSSQGWTYNFYVDTNGNGIFDSGDTLLTDTDGDGKVDTGNIPNGSSMNILAVAAIPPGSPDKSADSTTITATSDVNTAVLDQVTVNTTTTSPLLTLTKTVSPTGSQPPGSVLTYTIVVKNTGTGAATQVTINDPVPSHTSYVSGSLKSGSDVTTLIDRTDADDGDGAKFDSGSKSIIVGGSGFNLGPNATLVVRFQVTID